LSIIPHSVFSGAASVLPRLRPPVNGRGKRRCLSARYITFRNISSSYLREIFLPHPGAIKGLKNDEISV
jgi:hypothetical protein